jgi:hypothetical protein
MPDMSSDALRGPKTERRDWKRPLQRAGMRNAIAAPTPPNSHGAAPSRAGPARGSCWLRSHAMSSFDRATRWVIALAHLLFLFELAVFSPAARAADPDLQAYAQQCDAAMDHVTVPGFNCLDGLELPMVGEEGVACEKPPYLPLAGCYRYSRIGDLGSTDDVGLVFLCRHKKKADEHDNHWNDIAVIQTNYRTGKTCFYQQLDNKNGTLEGIVPAPSTGEGRWITPRVMAEENNACIACHDNGAYLRTPYVMQQAANIKGLKNYGLRTKEEQKKYSFPGAEFLFWKSGSNWNGSVYRVVVDYGRVNCGICHTMGSNDVDRTFGTSSWLGLYSTGVDPTPYLAGSHGKTAFWMRPKLTEPEPDSQVGSVTANNCARYDAGGHCQRVLYEGQVSVMAERVQALSRK